MGHVPHNDELSQRGKDGWRPTDLRYGATTRLQDAPAILIEPLEEHARELRRYIARHGCTYARLISTRAVNHSQKLRLTAMSTLPQACHKSAAHPSHEALPKLYRQKPNGVVVAAVRCHVSNTSLNLGVEGQKKRLF